MPSSRPATRRPAGAERTRAVTPKPNKAEGGERPRGGLRLRAGFQLIVLALIVTLAFILVFPTAQRYATQQEEIARLRASVEVAQSKVDDLQSELDRWEDPAFIKAQARKRLSFVLPGETSYRVSDPENAPTAPASGPPVPEPADPAAVDPEVGERAPWYFELWDSAVEAGRP